MPKSTLSKASLCAFAIGALGLTQLQAADQTSSPGVTNFADGLFAQLLYLPAGLLLAAVLVELLAWKKSSDSLHRGVFVVLVVAVICSLASLAATLALPETSAKLAGSPFVGFKIGAAFTASTLIACVAKWLCFRKQSSEKTSKPKTKKRGRGRGRRRAASGGFELGPIAQIVYGICLTGALAALFAAPFFAKSPTVSLEQVQEEETGPTPEPSPSPAIPPELESPEAVAEPIVSTESQPPPPAEPTEEPTTVASVETPAETMAEEEPVASKREPEGPSQPKPAPPPVAIASVPKPAPAARPVNMQRGGLAGAETYKKLVEPIFRSRCYSCHGEEKQKGDLRLDTPEGIRQGGKSGPVIIAGNVEKSYLFELISLDESEDDIMPPKGKPLSESQISWIGGWIREGAALGDGAEWPVAEGAGGAVSAIDSMTGDITATDENAVQTLLDSGVMVRKLSVDGKLLEVDFSHSDRAAGSMQLEQLAPLADNIHTLDLKRTRVSDADLKILSSMSNLRILHLQRTKITDAAIPHFSQLKQLESVNLYNTKVSDAGLPELKKLTSLKKIYLWSTQVTPDGARELSGVLGSGVVNMGE